MLSPVVVIAVSALGVTFMCAFGFIASRPVPETWDKAKPPYDVADTH